MKRVNQRRDIPEVRHCIVKRIRPAGGELTRGCSRHRAVGMNDNDSQLFWNGQVNQLQWVIAAHQHNPAKQAGCDIVSMRCSRCHAFTYQRTRNQVVT